MAKTYTTTINIDCWKEHTCISCGAVHAYQFKRKIAGRGRSADVSNRNAQASVAKTLKSVVDLHPCPACGIYQPDMIGQQRGRVHRITFWLTLAAFVTLVILRASYVLQMNIATWLIVGVGVLATLQFFGKELKNLNANCEANRAVAADRIAAGKMVLTSGEPANASSEWVRPPRTAAQKLVVPLLLIGIAALAAAELLRMSQHWPLNAGAYPPVVGPGDQTRIYMHDKIDSINGYWRGTPDVTLTQPGAGEKKIPLTATANQNNWGNSISVDSGNEHNGSTPWVEMRLPDDASLARKTVECDAQLDIEYPQSTTAGNFETESGSMYQHATLQLAAANAGGLYDSVWWAGGIGGMVMILGTGLLLIVSASRLQARATPTRILKPAAPV